MMTDDQTPADPQAGEAAAAAESEPSREQLRAELAEWRDKALRAAAEAENTRRRAERESNDARAYAIQRFATDLFQAADNLEQAVMAAPKDAADPAIRNLALGIEMTEKALQSAFERNGLKRIAPAKGTKFDPHLHQAMLEEQDTDAEPGTVAKTMRAGYELFGRVVRPAMVAVAAKRDAQAAGEGPNNPYAQSDESEAGGAVDTKA